MNIKDIKWFNSEKRVVQSIINQYGVIDEGAVRYFLSKISFITNEIKNDITLEQKAKLIQILKIDLIKISTIYVHCKQQIKDIVENMNKYEEYVSSLHNKTNDFDYSNFKQRVLNLPKNYEKISSIITNFDNKLLKVAIKNIDDKFEKDNKNEVKNNILVESETQTQEIDDVEKKRKERLKAMFKDYTMDGSKLDNIEKYGVSFKPVEATTTSKSK